MPKKRTDKNANKPLVGILVGSRADLPYLKGTLEILERFAVPFELNIGSAHRTPDRVIRYSGTAESRGLKAIIVGAGAAAHLAGAVAARTILPVLAIPLPTTNLQGMDALLATVQMPAGIPVATLAVGEAGGTNAALLAVEILSLSDASMRKRLLAYRRELGRKVDNHNRDLHKTMVRAGKK